MQDFTSMVFYLLLQSRERYDVYIGQAFQINFFFVEQSLSKKYQICHLKKYLIIYNQQVFVYVHL